MPTTHTPHLRLALLTAASLAALHAAAQDTGTPPPATTDAQQDQRVEITGSHIKQIDAEGASPVQVINHADIQKTGASNLSELLQTITASSTDGNTITDINGGGTFSPGASQASLHNLGAQSTLVLLNSRRIAVFPLPNFQETFSNIDSIPLGAVDRVEILKVGGSSVYGSDAIAGVINIITRTDFKGLTIDASDQKSLKNGHFGEQTVGITAGAGDYASDGYNVMANVEFFKREPVMWSQVLGSVNPQYAAASQGYGTNSSYSYPGNIDFTAITGPNVAPCTTGTLTAGGECTYDRYTRFQAVPEASRVNGIVTGRKRLNDAIDAYAELDFSDIRTNYQGTYPVYGPAQVDSTWIDPATGQNNYFWERGLPLTNPLNTTGEDENNNDFRYRFLDAPSYTQTDTTQYRALAGLKGTYLNWDFDTALGVLGATTHDRERGSFSNSGFIQEIGDYGTLDPSTGQLTPVSADFFNVPGGYRIGQPNSADVIDTLFPSFGWNATTRQVFVDGQASTDLTQFMAGPLKIATGFELRHETMVLTPTQNLQDNDIVGFAYSASDGERTYGAVFTELQAELTKTLEVGLAGRLDKFPAFGAHFSPRANALWRPVDILAVRGTLETGFRAPNLQESSHSTKTAYQPGISDPTRCPQATKFANDLRQQAANDPNPDDADALLAQAEQVQSNECSESVSVIVLNNPSLKPERSLSKSLGAVLQATKDVSFNVDYWSILRKNEINLKSVQDLLSAESSQPTGIINRTALNPNIDPTFTTQALIDQYGVTTGPISTVRQQYGNLFETRTSGIDFGVKGDVPTPVGKWQIGLDGTYTLNYQAYSPTRNGTGGWGDNLAGRYGYPRWNTVLTNSLVTGNWTNTLRWTHQSAQALQLDFDDTEWSPSGCEEQGLTPDQCQVKSLNQWDYAVSWDALKNLTLGANVINVFQKRPPVDLRAFNGPAGIIPVSIPDAEGRQLKLWFSYKFL